MVLGAMGRGRARRKCLASLGSSHAYVDEGCVESFFFFFSFFFSRGGCCEGGEGGGGVCWEGQH